MESMLKSPMKLILLTAWLSSLMDPCSLSNNCHQCHPLAACKAQNGSNPACFCNQGYTGDGTTFCEDDNECRNVTNICGDRGNCTNTVGSYYCTCVSGYTSTGVAKFQPNDGTECIEHPQKYCHDNIGCITQTVNKTLEYMSNLTEPQSLLDEIAKQTSGELTSVEVIAYVEALCRSASTLAAEEKDYAVKPSVINSTLTVIFKLVKAVNNLVEKDELVAWSRMKEDRREHTITKLLHSVEERALTLANNYKTPAEIEIKASEMELKVFTFDVRHMKATLSASMGGDHINLTPKLRPQGDRNGSVSVLFVRYDSIADILKPARRVDTTDGLQRLCFPLCPLKPVDAAADGTTCAFWEYEPGSFRGHWATHGCKTVHVSSNATTCSCDHLTHFAILMSSGRLAAHNTTLTRITQLGMIISLICLSMCIFTFWFFSEIQSTRTTIHKNLCCSLFMAEFIFLVGINMNTHKLFCSVIAGLLHYFFLAAFSWMCIEGIHLYLIVVGVIYNKGFLHRNFYIFGYGSPAVVVAISATLGSKYYGTDKVCWLSTENHFIWSFIGPACLIILVNLLAFGVIIYKVYRHTAVKRPEISHYQNIRSCARGAFALLFVLGATWTLGVLHILNETTLTAYLFTLANAFQGMFIFIFLCVLSRKIQEEYYRLFKNVPCCFECLR
uniref:Adhesion G protein-coupled receptor L4 n=1 Tax=Gasterosteus aculeatus aculeatus TaxID=481459 RepID=G3P4Q8_GASAC